MNGDQSVCQSCSMPVETGPYCPYCLDDRGELQAFEERVTRLSLFMRSREPELTVGESERRALEHMSRMPAWRDHPALRERLNRGR